MKDLTTGNESKVIFSFALPMLLGNVFQQSYNIMDSIIVGNYLGENYGRITDVGDNRVNLVEIIPNGTGGWLERPAAVEIVEQ